MNSYEKEQFRLLLSYYDQIGNEIQAKLLAATSEQIKLELSALQRQVDEAFNRLRVVFAEFADKVIPSAYKAKAYAEYMKIARRRGIGSAAGTSFIGRETNVLIANGIKGSATEAMEYGLANGQRNILKMLRATQQALLKEDAVNKAIAEGFDQASAYGGTRASASKRLFQELMDAANGSDFIEINGRKYNIKSYAELVARTKIMEANNQATVATAQEYGSDYVQASSHNTDCAICAPLEGKVYCISGKDKRFPPLTAAVDLPAHPNCILEGTRCESLGFLVSGLRAWYEGEIVELDFAHCGRIAVTINHMFLTPQGFISAELLREGDDVIYCPGFERSHSIGPDVNRAPTLIEDIFIALKKSSGMVPGSMPTSAENLHGDGKFIKGDIDVIGSNSFLGKTIESSRGEHFNKDLFKARNAELTKFSCYSDFTAMFKRLALAADGGMSSRRDCAPFFRSRAGIHEKALIGSCPHVNTGNAKPSPNGIPTDTETIANLLKKHPGIIKPDKLLNIKRRTFSGHVYSLQTETSLYVSNGILSSNCAHSYTVIFLETMERRGLDLYSDFSLGLSDAHPTNPKWVPVGKRTLL